MQPIQELQLDVAVPGLLDVIAEILFTKRTCAYSCPTNILNMIRLRDGKPSDIYSLAEESYDYNSETILTGFNDLNKLIGGFRKGDLIVIGGRPQSGKTSIAHNIALEVALTENCGTFFFTLETSAQKLTQRIIASLARVDIAKVLRNTFSDHEKIKIKRVLELLENKRFYIDDKANDIEEIERQIYAINEEKDISIVFIDYLQLITSSADEVPERRDLELGMISRTLKKIAKNLNISIVLISSLNRQIESRVDKHPLIHDIRDSGSIEDDADLIILLYRDELYNKSEDNPNRGMAEIIVAKNRLGPLGTINLAFIREFLRFETMSEFRGF